MISVLIRTIGRPSLKDAILSSKREFDNVIVVADAVDLPIKTLPRGVTYLKTGMRYDKYGSAAINMGAYACSTSYFCLLDDDDEFVVGAGDFMRRSVQANPQVDIWIPGLKFNNGMVLCIQPDKGIIPGNVAVPTYKTELLFRVPFYKGIEGKDPNYTDINHVSILHTLGYKIDWYNEILYLVRPKLDGTNGRGNL